MKRRLEPVTLLLMLACFGMVAAWKWFGDFEELPGAVRLIKLWEGEYWRLLTGLFQHAGWTHLILNGLSLYFVGTVVARGLGRPVYLATLLLGGQAAWAASFFWTVANNERVGISGGIAALLGLVLAVEWRNARTFGAFFRARNTLLIFGFIVLSVGLGFYIESRQPGVVVDHAAHLGGGVFGFLFGVAYYGPRGRSVVRAALVSLGVAILPVAYVCHPIWDPGYLLHRAETAWERDDFDEAAEYYDRLRERDAGHPVAAARLAEIRNDPSYLDGLQEERITDPGFAEALLRAHLNLARARLETDPESALALARAATRIRPAGFERWREFAEAAAQAARPEVARLAYEMTLNLSLVQRVAAHERPWFAVRILPDVEAQLRQLESDPTGRRLTAALRAAGVAREAAAVLAQEDLTKAQQEGIEQMIARVLERAGGLTLLLRADGAEPEGLRTLEKLLRDAYDRLAAQVEERAPGRAGRYYLRAAEWWWRAVEGTGDLAGQRESILAKARAARDVAREGGDVATEALAVQWLGEKGGAPRTGDLAGDPDGG